MADSNHHHHPSSKLPSEPTSAASPAAASASAATKNGTAGGVPSAAFPAPPTKVVSVLLSPLQEHSCEICGASGLSDDCMREHTRTCHVEGSAQCPFCGLSGVAPAELLLHVNQAHLDYLTPDNELMSFIDDQSPSVDGDSDSMSECPNGYTNGHNSAPTNGGAAATKLNGGACVSHHHAAHKASSSAATSSAPQPLTTAHALHQNGHHSHSHHQNHSHHQCTTTNTKSTTTTTTKGQQTKITNFYKKSMSADATTNSEGGGHEGGGGNGCSAAHHRAMHSTLKATHETRSCDNQDVLGAAGRDHQMGAAAATSASSGAATAAASAVTGNGGEGSPLRSQLGLNLKSHAPATAVKPSPLQCPMCPYTSDSSNVLEEHINRSHFDPLSPSMNGSQVQQHSNDATSDSPSSTSTTAGATTHTNGTTTDGNRHQHQQRQQAAHMLTALACPICGQSFEASGSLELHVNIEHRDILSPAAAKQTDTATGTGTAVDRRTDGVGSSDAATGGGGSTMTSNCPVCNISLDRMSTQQMEVHIEAHFPRSPQPANETAAAGGCGASGGGGGGRGGVDADLEKQAQKLREQREFEMLRAQYGMDDQGNFREQSAAGMQRAVYAGEMSVADYYERQVGLRAAESHGIDDGTSCTRSVAPRVASLSATSPNVMRSLMCSAVDHYASSYGDKGWGCGYRNLQMLLSSLLQSTTYNEALYSAWGNQGPSRTAMPSISRLQKMVEAAWTQGFDVQGSEQLGCKLHNTRKWIGATEVVTVLSWLRINCHLIDFHRPTSTDGRHPDLFSWVLRYFEEPVVHTPPLYLQHQGHSRTIIGIEQRANGPQLLILDPSHGPRQVAALGSSQDSLRLIRRGATAMRAPQYQIVAIRGLIETEDQYQASKVLRSLRIPPDC